MNRRVWLIASLLFGSGLCALVYQVVWLRELRLIFGASTMASAAVLAIFMGGLGFGSLILGRRADRTTRPLRFYAMLELGIAATAAATPFLIILISRIYVLSGGSPALGVGPATIARLFLSMLVLGTTTFLMGGTLPAASRAVGTDEDVGRRGVAALYGMNTLGGVTGVLLPTFLLFEHAGIHKTLWATCLVNLVVALAAYRLSRTFPAPASGEERDQPQKGAAPPVRLPPTRFVLLAAAAVGFAFLIMELVWYRMLGPILGGSTYTFGLILAVVLCGIGGGGLVYAVLGRRRPATLAGLAATCMSEAFFLVLPFTLGDRIAGYAVRLESTAAAGFAAQVLNWTVITSLVVLPGAIIAGYQFPLLIALLGRGRKSIGRHVGLGYAWNTIGAIAGSLAGGFGLMQALTAPGTWRMVVWLLLALGAAALFLSHRIERGGRRILLTVAALPLLIAMTSAEGPTAAWRHAPIGAGRIELADLSPNGIRMWMNETRRSTLWEAEGKESGVALQSILGLTFIINGKSDGSARYDAPTQVMYGLVGAILHPKPESALVIGLGTGSTAGWMADVPTITHVDVAELEPAIIEVARACEPVNRNVLSNPKVNIFLGDGREMLLTSRSTYDLIASEPSNPYRAGIASLFTREFYEAVRSRLNRRGIFLQWVQAYEVDEQTIRTIYATLGSVFERVETWQTGVGDLLLVCSTEPISYEAAAIRSRIGQEPYRSALAHTWRVTDLEGFLSRFVAGPAYARSISNEESGRINTDDHPLVEFGFARTAGRPGLFLIDHIRKAARLLDLHRPGELSGTVDWSSVEDHRLAMYTLEEEPPPVGPHLNDDQRRRAETQLNYLGGDLRKALRIWESQEDPRSPSGLVETAMVAHLLADAGRIDALPLIDRLREFEPVEADVILAILTWRRGRLQEAADAFVEAFERHRADPWPWPLIVTRGLSVARQVASDDPRTAARLFECLMEPFAVRQLEYNRIGATMGIARLLGPDHIVRAFESLEPHFIWDEQMLAVRADLYRVSGHPYAGRARKDLEAYRRNARKAASK